MKSTNQKQQIPQPPLDSLTPLRFEFDGKARRVGSHDNVRACYRAMDGKTILSVSGNDTEAAYASLRLCADLDSKSTRAITKRLRDAIAVHRRMSGGYSDLIQPREEMLFAGNTFFAEFNPTFLPRIAARISLTKDRILLELHGGNARVRLWLDVVTADALIYDLERAIQASEEFK